MAETPATGTEPRKGGSLFTKKWHGVPVPVLLGGAGVALYFGYKWYKDRQASSSSSTTTPSPTSTGDTTGTSDGYTGGGYTGGGYDGGGSGSGASGPLGTDLSTLTTDLTDLTGVLATLTPQPSTPGTTQVPYGTTVVTNPGGGTDQAAVTALQNAEAKLASVTKTGNKKAIKDATANVASAQKVVNSRNAAAGATAAPPPIPTVTKTSPTGVPAQQAPAVSKSNSTLAGFGTATVPRQTFGL